VAKPVASVALGQGGAVVKLTGPAVGPEECWGGATDQLKTGAIWVMEGPDDTAAVATVSDILSRAAKPSRQGQGLATTAYCVFPQLGLEDCGRQEVSIIISEAQDAEKHNRGIASTRDTPTVGPQVGEEDRIVFGDLIDLHLTFENEDKITPSRVW
jgi:hypothetical protein